MNSVSEISRLGIVFSYCEAENILQLSLHKAHVLPRIEAERVWNLVKTYAASHPDQPRLVVEIAGKQVEYGRVAGLSPAEFLPERDPQERRCLYLMAQRQTQPLRPYFATPGLYL